MEGQGSEGATEERDERVELVAAAERWLAGDPDPATREELRAVLDRADLAELRSRMTPLEFGTAGLRAVVGAGPGRLNRAVVIRTTRAVAEHLRAEGRVGLVVVGCDARTSSPRFAEDTVGVLAAAGFEVRYFAEPTPTPLVAYAARELGAVAAVCITASHNPAPDNGYKLYGATASQIVPPEDAAVEARIGALGRACDIPRLEDAFSASGASAARVAPVPAELRERYFAAALGVVPRVATSEERRALRVVYTPVHGVGGAWTPELLRRAGFSDVRPVPSQLAPDGRFPTAPFPNPELPDVLLPALAQAADCGASLVLANDPDADRLAVAVRREDGGYQVLSGNTIGSLLAQFLMENADLGREPPRLVLCSLVSTPLAERLARAAGARFATTLTGFKWIWHTALAEEAAGRARYLFGFEEAIGFGVGPLVRDKDGLTAALAFAELAASRAPALGAEGAPLGSADAVGSAGPVWDRLRRMFAAHGVWGSGQHSLPFRCEEAPRLLDALVERPPRAVGTDEVREVRDYRLGLDGLPKAELVALRLASGTRMLVRPSGTEPKLKIYADVCAPFLPDRAVSEQLAAADRAARLLAQELAATLTAEPKPG